MIRNYGETERNQLMHSNGTTSFETFSLIVPTFFFTNFTILVICLFINCTTKSKTIQFILEFITLVIPVILNVTVLAKYTISIIILLSIICVICSLLIYHYQKSSKGTKISKSKSKELGNNNFVTNARSTINLMSVIAILAVDFQIFPRRLAKTETFGFSLMDVGVGLFVYSNGIVASTNRNSGLVKSLKSSLPLFILGGARFFLTNELSYQVPVSEYGVHWNFFITLAITKVLSSLILNAIDVKYIVINAIFLIVSHELLLQAGLENFVLLNTKRTNFILANKEGLVSSLGYVSLYLFSVYFGYFFNFKNMYHSKKFMIKKFLISSISLLILTKILETNFGISRRLANSTYCFWILFIGIFMTGLYYSAEITQRYLFQHKFFHIYSPLVFQAINYNGLVFFLTANILTGLVNVIWDTLQINTINSLVIIITYMFANCLVVIILYFRQIKLKL